MIARSGTVQQILRWWLGNNILNMSCTISDLSYLKIWFGNCESSKSNIVAYALETEVNVRPASVDVLIG